MKRPAFILPLFLAAGLLVPATHHTPAAGVEPTDSSIRVATANVRAGVSTETFRGIAKELTNRADIVGFQEINSREKEAVLAELAPEGWAYYRPARYYGEQKPIMWRTSEYALAHARSVKTAGETFVGDEYGDTNPEKRLLKAHYVTVVRLVHLATGNRVVVINVHLPPGAVRGGAPAPDRPRLFKRYARELRITRNVAREEELWGRVFTLGDLNSGYVADVRTGRKKLPVRRFKAFDHKSAWASNLPPAGVGTHGDALIDQIFSRRKAQEAVVATDIKGSDHYPAIGWYTLP